MILVRDVLISEEALQARFACDLTACLGACCRVGDVGAPLAQGERAEVEATLQTVLVSLPAENREAIERAGWLDESCRRKARLACFPDGRCVFSVPAGGPGGPLGCALELVFRQGQSRFRKPLFCHLFPLTLDDYQGQRVLNAERRPECEPGFGAGIGLLEFSREALVRAFGAAWYDELLAALGAVRPWPGP